MDKLCKKDNLCNINRMFRFFEEKKKQKFIIYFEYFCKISICQGWYCIESTPRIYKQKCNLKIVSNKVQILEVNFLLYPTHLFYIHMHSKDLISFCLTECVNTNFFFCLEDKIILNFLYINIWNFTSLHL